MEEKKEGTNTEEEAGSSRQTVTQQAGSRTVAAMVLKVMRWPMRHLFSKKYQVSVLLHSLEAPALQGLDESSQVLVDVKWKGPKGALGSRFRRSMKSSTGVEGTVAAPQGRVDWDQQFQHVCVLSVAKTTTSFLPWDVYFVIRLVGGHTRLPALLSLSGCSSAPPRLAFTRPSVLVLVLVQIENGPGSKPRRSVLGAVFVNLAAFASTTGNSSDIQRLPVICTLKGVETQATLTVSRLICTSCTLIAE